MFKRKRNEESVPEFAVVLQREIDEIMNIVEEQQKEIERLKEQYRQLHELCLKGME